MKFKLISKTVSAVTAAALVVTLAACGSTGEKSAAESSAAAQSSAVELAQLNAKITLYEQFDAAQTEGEKQQYELYKKAVAEKFPNLEVDWQSWVPGSDYREQYDKLLMAGNAPTAAHIFSYTDIPTRVANNSIADISNFVNNWDLKKQDKVLSTFDDAIQNNGKWYAVPYEAYLCATAFNKETIKKAGGDPANLPKTWDEFGKMGQQYTDKAKARFGYELIGMDWNAWPFTGWVWGAGGEMVTKNTDGTWKIAFNEEPGVDAAMFWNEMVWKYKMTQKDVLIGIDPLIQDVCAGRACFAWGYPTWFASTAEEKYGGKSEDFGLMPMPVKDSSIAAPALSGGEVWTFNPKADKDQLKAAWDVVQLLSYDESFLESLWKLQNDNKNMLANVPARKDLMEKKYSMATYWPASWKEELITTSKNAKPEPYCAHWGDLKSALAKPLQKIILKENIQRDEVKKLLDDCANELYQKYPDTFKK